MKMIPAGRRSASGAQPDLEVNANCLSRFIMAFSPLSYGVFIVPIYKSLAMGLFKL
jgi:hypothetical protein